MKLVVMFIAFIVAGLPVGDLATIRKEYVNAAVSEQSTNNFYKRFEDVTDTHQNTTLVAYKAVSIVLKARYESGLFSKKRLFDKGTSLLDATIKKTTITMRHALSALIYRIMCHGLPATPAR
jgi:hypothetical protein